MKEYNARSCFLVDRDPSSRPGSARGVQEPYGIEERARRYDDDLWRSASRGLAASIRHSLAAATRLLFQARAFLRTSREHFRPCLSSSNIAATSVLLSCQSFPAQRALAASQRPCPVAYLEISSGSRCAARRNQQFRTQYDDEPRSLLWLWLWQALAAGPISRGSTVGTSDLRLMQKLSVVATT